MNFIINLVKLFVVTALLFLMAACEQPEEEAKPELIVPVEVTVVSKDIVKQSIPITGMIKANQSVDVLPEANGKVTKVIKKLGDRVVKNDTLAFIDDVVAHANYQQAKAQVISANNNLRIAELTLESDKILYNSEDISKLAYESSILAVKNAEANLLSAKANLSMLKKAYFDTRIVSPISGFIARKNIELGTMVSPAAPAYSIVDIKKLKITLGIPQMLIDRAKIGTQAKVTITALNNETFIGKLVALSPMADAGTGTFEAEILLDNTVDNRIKPGMTCNTELIYSDHEPKLTVPDYSVVKKNGELHLYKVVNGYAKLIPVKDGESFGDKIIVTEGLSEGDTVVVVGMNNLGENTKIKIEAVN